MLYRNSEKKFSEMRKKCNFSFLKNSLMQINSKLNSKLSDYLYKVLHNYFIPCHSNTINAAYNGKVGCKTV